MNHLLAELISLAINLVIFIVFAQVVVQWLIAFDVFRVKTPQAHNLVGTLNQFTSKIYRPIQKYVPPIGGIDLTPVIVILGLNLLSSLVWQVLVY